MKRNQYSESEFSFFIFYNLFLAFFLDRYDYLRITNDKNQAVGTYCGYQVGERVVVVGSGAVLLFASESSVLNAGFHLSFTFQQGKFKNNSWKLIVVRSTFG